jgi:hypothetical protein
LYLINSTAFEAKSMFPRCGMKFSFLTNLIHHLLACAMPL